LLELYRQRGEAGDQLGGWLFQAGLPLERALFDALSDALPGAVFGEHPVSMVQAEQLAAQGITLCWQEGLKLNCRGKRLRVLQIHQRPDLRALKQTVEEQCAAGVELLLLVVPPNSQIPPPMRELQTFVNLFNG
jgi:hypothetical protein